MAESKLANVHGIKSHPLLAPYPRKSLNKVKVTVHPKVLLVRKKPEQKVRKKSNTILNVGNSFGQSSQIEISARREPNYLEMHFAYASAVGAAPYKFDNTIKWQLKGPYFLLNSLAMLDNFLIIWESVHDAIEVNSTTEIGVYVYLAKNIAYVMLRIVHIVSLWKDADKFANIFTTFSGTYFSNALTDRKKTAFAVGVSVMGLIRALSRSLEGITSGTHFMLIRHCGRIIKKFVQDWNSPENIDFPCGLLGVLGFVTKFSGGIIQQVALTGPLMAAATLLSACKEFKYKKEAPQGMEIGTANANSNASTHGLQIGTRYGELKKISKAINRAFSPVLKLALLAHLLMFASLIDNIFTGNLAKGKRAWMLFDAVLACVFLYLANAVGNTGGRFREWLKVDQNRIQVGMSQLDVIQEELSSHAIGIGREAFFISDGFLLGYVGAIVAYFFGIVETRPKIASTLECGHGGQNHTEN